MDYIIHKAFQKKYMLKDSAICKS